ncbi:MAG: diacylglycerol kinase family lipid kinase [Firmicutes bacterium]|nr:diacylglycerol kinase family lipid kinase [Bacillota bacterium]
MSIAIIANPYAGKGRSKKVAEQVTLKLRDKDVDFEIFFTDYPKQAVELASQAAEKHEIIAALGGDGTINEVLTGMLNSKSQLAIIPGGTGNDYARGLNIPTNPDDALEVILQRHSVKMDVIKERSRNFGVVSTIGFPSTVLDYVNSHRDSFFKGSIVFTAAIIKTIHDLKVHPINITIDGETRQHSVVGVILMNMPYGGGGLMFAPNARYNDGYISVVIIKELKRLELMKTLPLVYFGKHVNHPKVEIIQCRRVSITADESLLKTFDGELESFTPFDAVIHPQAVSVITNFN